MHVMHRRAVALVGGGLLATWLVAAAQQPRQAAPPPDDTQAAAEASTVDRAELMAREIQSQAARLRGRLAVAPQPRDDGRNPFAFVDRPRPSSARLARAPSAPLEADPPVISIPEPPPFTLSGIAEDGAADAPIRTAVLAGFGDVFLVKAGDTVASRYRVVAVSADAVELEDLSDGRTIRLGLR